MSCRKSSTPGGTWKVAELCSVYQSFDWCKTWLAAVGEARGISPCIVVGQTPFGKTQFILPLQVRHKWGLTIIEMLTAPQGAYSLALFDNEFLKSEAADWFAAHLADVISVLPQHDVFRLADAPKLFEGYSNPLLQNGSFTAANYCHIMDLHPDFDTLMQQKRSSETRRSLRKRDAKLEAAGRLLFDLPQATDTRRSVLTQMFDDQEKRLGEAGIHNVFDHLERDFLHRLVDTKTPEGPFLRPYHLSLDGKTEAVLLGAYFRQTYWALVSSLADSNHLKLSPGDYALRRMFKDLCQDGTLRIDFAAGDSAYKHHWSDSQVSLHLVLRASSLFGMPVALLMLLREQTKRLAKRTPILNRMANGLRKLMAGKKSNRR